MSSDVFFYQLGQRTNPTGDDSRLLQTWGRRLGLGRRTGIDLPNELPGLMPTPRWRNELYDDKLTDRPWSVGDNINLSVGQGDLKANPLQMAVAYAAVANGGKVVRPHLGLRIEDASGRVLQELEPPTPRKLPIDASYRQAILEGLRGAASAAGGTSTSVFAGFPVPIAGKTGHGGEGPRPGRPVLVRRARALPEPRLRGGGHRRGRRVRRRHRRADGARDPGHPPQRARTTRAASRAGCPTDD